MPLIPVLTKTPYRKFSPARIPGLQLWLRADAGVYQDAAKTTPAVADGDVVGAWADLSGAGNDATQATTAKKPLLKLNIVNGKSVVRFDGTDDFLAVSPGSDFNFGTGDFSLFIVAEMTSTPAVAGMFIAKRQHNNDFEYRWATAVMQITGPTVSGLQAVLTTQFYIFGGIRDSGVFQHYRDGATDGVVGAWATDIDNAHDLYINSRAGTDYFTALDCGEILIYNAALSTADRRRLEQYLAAKYNITLA